MFSKSVTTLALLFCTAAAFAYEEQTGPVKAQLKIDAGVEAGFNLDESAFGITNYIREIGIWAELFNSDLGTRQVKADPEAEAPQVSISVQNFKLAVKTYSNKEVNNGGVELQPNYSGNTMGALIQDAKGNSVNIALTYKGFWLGLVNSIDGYVGWGGSANQFFPSRSGFDYTGTSPLPNGAENTNAGLFRSTGSSKALLGTAGLFVPDSSQWDNNPESFAPTPTYYTLSTVGAVSNKVLTATDAAVNPYDNAMTKGLLRFGYNNALFTLDAGVGTKNGGVSLFSSASQVNKENAANYQVNVSVSPVKAVRLQASYLGGVNYAEADGGTPFGYGGMAAASLPLWGDAYLVPFVAANYLNAHNEALVYTDTYSASAGLKYLWAGEVSVGKNAFSSTEAPRGLSVTASDDDQGTVNLQAAFFDPAGRASLVRNVGVQAFAELKNATGSADVDSGKSLWGAGVRINYLAPGALNVYGYGHYKLNATTENAGQTVVRAGVEYTGIASLVIDTYYLMGRLDQDSTNLGNLVCDLKFSY